MEEVEEELDLGAQIAQLKQHILNIQGPKTRRKARTTTPKSAQEMDYGPHTEQGQQSDSHRGPSAAHGVVPRGKPKSKSGGVFEETATHIIHANLIGPA